jgi:hypothetical protein
MIYPFVSGWDCCDSIPSHGSRTVSTIRDSVVVELGFRVGFEVSTKVSTQYLSFFPSLDGCGSTTLLRMTYCSRSLIPVHAKRLETTGVKTLVITARYKHAQLGALGYFRASNHGGNVEDGLFSAVTDYTSIEKDGGTPSC